MESSRYFSTGDQRKMRDAFVEAQLARIDAQWPQASYRVRGGYRWYIFRQHELGHRLPTFAEFLHVSDQELLQLRYVGTRTLKEIRHLGTYAEWDAWAATLPAAWQGF